MSYTPDDFGPKECVDDEETWDIPTTPHHNPDHHEKSGNYIIFAFITNRSLFNKIEVYLIKY